MSRSDGVAPFRIAVQSSALEDLQERLRWTRLPDQIEGAGSRFGISTNYVRELCDYWREGFDWRAVERTLNRYDQFRTTIDGESIHLLHQRSARAGAIPLLMVHGWPSTVFEWHKVIEPLVSPSPAAPAFHVVCPSLPGFAWSGPTQSPGWDVRRMARAFVTLMDRLGYRQFAVHGTDWGSIIGTEMALAEPARVIGLHLNMVLVRPPLREAAISEAERQTMERQEQWLAEEMGYDVIQSTKPQTLGVALNDSPAGLATWIVEKYQNWSDCGGEVERRFSKDDLLATVATYWLTGTITSSMRLYREYATMQPRFGFDGKHVEVPTACAMFPAEMYHPPRSWVEARYDVRRWSVMPAGGHFPALEEPELLVDDIRAFFGER
ncbi:MAG: epoxide hydrolase [Actinomycetota bacterium]|nr:epoxide hydrolase [Actinomycetota bacterium]